MAQAIMDPEEVRRFATELKRFNDDVQTMAASLQARFISLGSSWQAAVRKVKSALDGRDGRNRCAALGK